MPVDQTDTAGKFLLFRVGEERFALPAVWAAEVVLPQAITPLPGTPAFVPGVFLLRGEVIPLVDLSVLAGGSPLSCPRAVLVRLEQGPLAFGASATLGMAPLEGAKVALSGEPPGCHLLRCEREGATVIAVDPIGLMGHLTSPPEEK